ncbi:prolipoprotein diacylglyceryl transferase [Candidatus Omnitrophota bacterium]
MYPLICQIGRFSIYSYGLMLAIAVLVCGALFARDAEPLGVSRDCAFDFVFWVVFSGILGARVFFVLLNAAYFLKHPVEMVMVQQGGLSWQGGLIGGSMVALIYVKIKKLPLLKMLDVAAPYVALGQAIGRIGCLLNGCCYGRPVAWGMYFPVHQDRLHPTQIYMTCGLLVLFFVLKKVKKALPLDGQSFVCYLFGASFLRFFIEYFRADHGQTYLGLSVFQIVCLMLMGSALYVLSRLKS